MTLDELTGRVARLERQNRTLRSTVVALALAALGVVGWQAVAPANSQNRQQVVVGQNSITLLRADGSKAADWVIHDVGDAMLAFYDNEGKEISYFGGNGHKPAFVMRNKKDEAALSMGVDQHGMGGLILGGANNRVAAALDVSAEGDPSLAFYPKDEKSSITIGYMLSVPWIRLMDKDGNVVWGNQ
jgi:hypothetical protein